MNAQPIIDSQSALDWLAEKYKLGRKPAQDKQKPEPSGEPSKAAAESGRPGDDFSARRNWDTELATVGLNKVRVTANETDYLRDGSINSKSATLYHDSNRLTVWTDKLTPLEKGKTYTLFEFRTTVKHNGDFKAAASQLKREGYGDQTGKKPASLKRGRDISPREVLINCMSGASFWRDQEDNAYATFIRNGHLENHKVKSSAFKRLLTAAHFLQTGKGVSGTALQEAIGTLEAKAMISDNIRSPALRFAECGDKLYLDLCDADWSVVEIDAGGFKVITSADCPIPFVRKKSMRPLPKPQQSSDQISRLEELWRLVNVGTREWRLILSCVVACLRPGYPMPVLVLRGEQGSGKSTLLGLLRMLIDPNTSNVRNLPKDEESLFLQMASSGCLVYQNVSTLPGWLSDALCTISTGGGFVNRKLYENDEENIFEGIRAIWIDGIANFVTRPDLAERTTSIWMPIIPPDKRKGTKELYEWFKANHGQLLAELLMIVSVGIKNLPAVQLKELPRMADFAAFACAAAPAIGWTADEFMTAFNTDKENEQADLVDNSSIAKWIIKLMEFIDQDPVRPDKIWSGSPSELLDKLKNLAGTDSEKATLPKMANTFSTQLNRIANPLRSRGIDVQRKDNGKKGTLFTIVRLSSNDGEKPVITTDENRPEWTTI